MSFLNIAIIHRQTINEGEPVDEFLVQCNEEGMHMFFDVREISINGGFDFSKLQRYLVDYFELNTREDLIEFQEFKLEKNAENATAYRFTCSLAQSDFIDYSVSNNKDVNKWSILKWVKKDELLNLCDTWKEEQKFIFEGTEPFTMLKFSNELRAALRNITKAKEQGKLVIFAGAGVSVDSFLPTWNELSQSLKEDLNTKENEDLKIAQLYYENRGNKEYQERVREVLKFGKTKYNPIHEAIVDISPLHIITTNYDDHFEQIHSEKGFKYSIIKDDSDIPYSKGVSLFIKMHGDLERRNIVLKEEDYNYETKFPLIDGYVKGIFASCLVVFVGFSNDDKNLERIQKWVEEILKGNGQRPYLVVDTMAEEKKKKKQIKGNITIIEIGNTQDKKAINKYFEGIATPESKSNIEKFANQKGKNLFKFLNVLSEYDLVSDALDVVKIDKQFEKSLSRFKGLEVLPKSTLEHILPLQIKGPSMDSSLWAKLDYGDFETPNEDWLKFVKSKSLNGKIKFHSFINENQTQEQQNLDKLWKLLYNSGIYKIKRKYDESSNKIELEPIDLKTPKGKHQCYCANCRLGRYELNDLLNELNKLSEKCISNHSTSEIEMSHAVGYFKTGYIIKAYYTLEELKTKSWKTSNYVNFYFALYNQKVLRLFINYFNAKNYADHELNSIKQRIDKIDLTKILVELPVDKDVKNCLSEIHERKLQKSTAKVVAENFDQIKDIYERYKKGGYRHNGPNYWYIMEYKVRELSTFYSKNLLFDTITSDFYAIANNYIEGIIVSFQTSDDYKGKVKQINWFFVDAILDYGNSKKILEFLDTYKVEKFVFYKQNELKPILIERYERLLNSGYTENTFFKSTIKPNELFESACSNSAIFSDFVTSTFNNFLLLFANIELSQEEYNKITSLSLKFLSASNEFGFVDSLKYWAYFISRNIEVFSEETLIEIVQFYLSGKPNGFSTSRIICNAISSKTKKSEFLPDEIAQKFIMTYENEKYSKNSLFGFFPFFRKESKVVISEVIKKDLLVLSNQYRTEAFYWGIWTIENDRNIFDLFLNTLTTRVDKVPNFQIDKDGELVNVNDFTTWNDLVHLTEWVYSFNLFDDDKVVEIQRKVNSDLFKWLLNPDDYNYEIFELNWIVVLNGQKYFQKWKNTSKLIETLESKFDEEFNSKAAEVYFKLKKNVLKTNFELSK